MLLHQFCLVLPCSYLTKSGNYALLCMILIQQLNKILVKLV
jgi:hypothetical protein